MTCAESRQNARQTENRIHHYESSYQRNHYESTYERTSSTFQTSRNEEPNPNLQERREREQIRYLVLPPNLLVHKYISNMKLHSFDISSQRELNRWSKF